ncbi:MAG: preprotein translocase subunit SecY [Chloroflexi bacterium]|jgi:preprotein translocase subunit SecY|nr:preprotein translocase subunit SecY [Chloroflexota bacterium]MBT3669338.1 preprotein translocase subunit SecY [Chloroflexota bacterium]MBT4003463.1 preprotein translocase subunit SecY [Chloroflexota bacterium]MBT4306045.1 preprotein translocase subunit SecY [Chloroflexota bacterium]MBT4532689.1 preprotein translocase subunit SecY [Chloroflexota bacterium]
MKQRSGWRYLWTTPDLRRKLLFSIGLLILYRFVSHVRVPGVDNAALDQLMNSGGAGSNLVNLINMISGGTVSNFSVLAMGVYPYITAQIIIQLLTPIIPAWQARMEDDPREARKWQEKRTYYLAVVMAALQAYGQIRIFSSLGGLPIIPGFGFTEGNILSSVTVLAVMTAGTMFAIWMGELISEHGIRGQGLSLIIFAGIISQLPSTYIQLWSNPESRVVGIISLILITLAMIFVIVFVQQGRRNVPVMYPGRRVGNRMAMPVKGNLPLMVNMSGMIPLIFAQAILSFPAILAGLFQDSETEWVQNFAITVTNVFGAQSNLYWVFYFIMVIAFAFFYTNVLFQQQNYGDNLKRSGAKIGNVRPGNATQEYLGRVQSRITLPGALFLGVVAVLPYLATLAIPALRLPGNSGFLINSSGLLIVVGVVRDTFLNIDAELKLHGYDDTLLVK